MTDLKIITNNVPRLIIDDYELNAREREEFDYLNWDAIDRGEDSASFVRYKGQLYHLGDMERSNVPGWDAQVTDTFFSAVLFRYVPNDSDYVICGRCYS